MAEFGIYITAFLAGLLGGVHCLGMCGGIVSALTLGSHETGSSTRSWSSLLFYNIGRITSYTLAGVLVGGLGAVITQQFASHTLHQVLQTLSGVVMILMGLYLARWSMLLVRLEKAGTFIWRFIEPFARGLLPIRRWYQALMVGMLWGWLPCGLVYSMLSLSLTTASAVNGGLVMASFGLGTLPNLLLIGLFAGHLQAFMRHPWVRIVAGLLVIILGVYLIYMAWLPADEHAHHHHH